MVALGIENELVTGMTSVSTTMGDMKFQVANPAAQKVTTLGSHLGDTGKGILYMDKIKEKQERKKKTEKQNSLINFSPRDFSRGKQCCK